MFGFFDDCLGKRVFGVDLNGSGKSDYFGFRRARHGRDPATAGEPRVSVPVLSNITTSRLRARSSASLSFTSRPFCAPSDVEMAITSGIASDHTLESMNKFQMQKSETVLFGVDKDTLTPDAKTQLEELSKQASGLDRYVIEVQGFTDKTGPAAYNETLSERRAQTVARYLSNQYQIPVRSISMLGSGYAQPVADDKTREGRKMNRRVEVRLWVPETETTQVVASGGSEQ